MARIKKSAGDKIFDGFNVILMLAICFATIYPIWYVLIHSFNNGYDSVQGGVYWWPRAFTVENYKEVFRDKAILTAFGVTIARTLIATTVHVFFTSMVAYAFMSKQLIGRKVYMTMGVITMFFSGGLIPTFIVIKMLGMFDKFIVYIIPGMFYFFDLIIIQAFFRSVPEALEESAKIDGANEFVIFTKIILPVSKPVIATMLLFNGVYNWNDYFMGIIYTNREILHPIQTYLYRIIVTSSATKTMMSVSFETRPFTSQSLQMATMIATTLPIVCVYPFLQKHFVKGMLLGSVKG